MDFFRTSEGRLHAGRIAGIIYLVGLLPGCEFFRDIDRLCVMRIVSTVGWWFSFCDYTQPPTFAEMARHPRNLLGLIILVAGLIGQFYVIGRR